jgi:hypothetical protein
MKPKFKIKDFTKYYIQWDGINKCLFISIEYIKIHHRLGQLLYCDIEAFESFLTHNPKAKNLTLESAKELLKTFLDNQKH